MKILLIYPWYPVAAVTTFEEPIGVLYLAAMLEKDGYQVRVEDLTFRPNPACINEQIRQADLVGLSATSPLYDSAVTLLRHIRQMDGRKTALIGGPHATAAPAQVLADGFNIAVLGEGEATLLELVRTLEAGRDLRQVAGIAYQEEGEVVVTPPRPFLPNLDELPFPQRRFIDYTRYRRVGMISMRGCPYQCSYCKPIEDVLFGNRLRRRSLENVTSELDDVIDRYGNRPISFKDDTLTLNHTSWFEVLADHFVKRGLRLVWQCSSRVDTIDPCKLRAMKKAGCRQIFFGIESGSQRILDYYHKGIKVEQIREAFALCRETGIRACASIMLGAPDETREELEATYQLVTQIRPFNWHVHITTPICGSHLYDWARRNGRLTGTAGTSSQVFAPTSNLYRCHLPMKLDHLTIGDIVACRDRINRFMKYRVLLNCLFDGGMWRELLTSKGMRAIAVNYLRRHFARQHSLLKS